jgi:serine/threonine protein kinase
MIGQTVSHYRILEKLGEGGMGVVYKAEDLKLQRLVALKFLAEGPAKDAALCARFEREAHAAARLDHPNICPVYGLEAVAGTRFIVMAFVDGPSLARGIGKGMPLGEALDHAIGVAQGLKCAHERGVIHRDIKAANVMLTSQGIPRITDFGLARVEDRSRLTQPGTLMGTVSSMPPEQLRGEDSDRRADIWGFGVLLYEMVTGRKPFQRADVHATTHAVLLERQAPPSVVNGVLPAELDRVVEKALAKKREERYQHFDDLIVDLRAVRRRLSAAQESHVVGREPGSDAPTVTRAPGQPQRRRWRWPWAR